jgi:hypothetical protein
MDDFEEMRELLKEIVIIQNQQAKMLFRHSEILAEHDERMERIGRHLEVLASMTDDLIRNKADRKRR